MTDRCRAGSAGSAIEPIKSYVSPSMQIVVLGYRRLGHRRPYSFHVLQWHRTHLAFAMTMVHVASISRPAVSSCHGGIIGRVDPDRPVATAVTVAPTLVLRRRRVGRCTTPGVFPQWRSSRTSGTDHDQDWRGFCEKPDADMMYA